jgi:hypothetical protein
VFLKKAYETSNYFIHLMAKNKSLGFAATKIWLVVGKISWPKLSVVTNDWPLVTLILADAYLL